MKVKELISKLLEQDQEKEVVLLNLEDDTEESLTSEINIEVNSFEKIDSGQKEDVICLTYNKATC